MYKTFALILTIILVSISTSSIQAKDNWDKWRIMENNHFRIYSDAKEKKVRALLEDLEKFRLVVERALLVKIPKSAPKTNVLFFKSTRKFKQIAPERNIAGFVDRVGGTATIVMASTSRGLKSESVIKHEYVHIAQAYDTNTNPQWFREGMAEMFANVKYHAEYAALGAPNEDRWRYFSRQINYNEIISSNFNAFKNRRGSDAYAQYWLLTNFILTHDDGTYRDELSNYLYNYRSGIESKIAFKKAFGQDANSFGRHAMKMYNKRTYSYNTLIYKIDLTKMDLESTFEIPVDNRVSNIMAALSKSLEDW